MNIIKGDFFLPFFLSRYYNFMGSFFSHCILSEEIITSIHVCGQRNRLVELIFGGFIGWLSLLAHIETANDQDCFLEVHKLLQEMCGPEQRFVLRAVVQIVNKEDFHKLGKGLTDLVVADGVCSSHKHQHLSLGPFLPQDFQTSSFRVQPGHGLLIQNSENAVCLKMLILILKMSSV